LHPQTDEEQDDREYVQAKVCDRLLARKLAGKGAYYYAYQRPDGVFVIPVGCLKD